MMEIADLFDAEQCLTTVQALHNSGDVVELRAVKPRPDTPGWEKTASGFYDNYQRLIEDAEKLNGRYAAIYVSLNPPKPELLSRSANRISFNPSDTVGDADIQTRRWLFLDFDPVRSSGIPATDAEQDLAFARARECREYLSGRGWPEPVRAASGNGAHLLYRIDLVNDDISRHLIDDILKALAAQYSDERVEMDAGTGNASRLAKLYGTLSAKGDAIGDRPHRLARLLREPDPIEVVSHGQLRDLGAMNPTVLTLGKQPNQSEGFDLEGWIAEKGLDVVKVTSWNGGRKWILAECPWDASHTDQAAYIVQLSNGAVAAGCHHSSCRGKAWHDLRDAVEPGWRDERSVRPYRDNGTTERSITYNPRTASDLVKESPEVCWLVSGILPVGGSMVLVGDAGSGKTWLTMALAIDVDQGRPWLGQFKTRQAKVLVIDEENANQLLKRRLEQLQRGARMNPDCSSLGVEFLTAQGVNLSDEASISAVDMMLDRHRPDLVIIDALVRIHRGNENDAMEMAKVFSVIKRWMVTYDCAFVFCHHRRKPGPTGNDPNSMFRGSSEIRAFVDSHLDIQAVKGEDGILTVSHAKSRFAEPVSKFRVAITDTAAGATEVRYDGLPKPPAEQKREEASDFLLNLVADGERHYRQDVIDKGSEVGLSRDILDGARKDLVTSGDLFEGNDGKTKYICLPERSVVPELPIERTERSQLDEVTQATKTDSGPTDHWTEA